MQINLKLKYHDCKFEEIEYDNQSNGTRFYQQSALIETEGDGLDYSVGNEYPLKLRSKDKENTITMLCDNINIKLAYPTAYSHNTANRYYYHFTSKSPNNFIDITINENYNNK